MSVLLIDVGNSRCKWNYCADIPQAAAGATLLLKATQAVTRHSREEMESLASAMRGADVRRVLVSNVGGKEVELSLRNMAAELQLPIEILPNGLMAGVLRSSDYVQASQLGVDRCLVMIGALGPAPKHHFCVVNSGTAVTVDFVLSRGHHLGGMICPGLYAMQQKVVENAAAINLDLGVTEPIRLFPTSTRQAIASGAAYAIAGLVQKALNEVIEQHQGQWNLVLTGGGSAEIASLLPATTETEPDLLMRGLALVAQQQI